MSDKEYAAIKKKLDDYVRTWRLRLGLNWWKLDIVWTRERGEAKDGGYRTAATCVAHWKYLNATIEFFLQDLVDKPDDELENLVVHELCHALVNEMQEEGMAHEERVVSTLTNAFLWTAAMAAKEALRQRDLQKLRKRKTRR